MKQLKLAYEKVTKFFEDVYHKRRRYEKILVNVVIYALLITVSYVFVFPLISMISQAMMSPSDLINPEIDYIPQRFYVGNFAVVFTVLKAGEALFNSIWFSTVLAVSQTTISAFTGFAFARYEFRFKKILFALILVSFIIPIPIILIPRIMMFVGIQEFTSIQMIGTVIPQILMSLFGQGVNSAILILIFYNFFRMIPNVLYEAAKIDGATSWEQFIHITIRMSLTTIIVVFLFSFVWNWNETYITGLLLRNNVILLPTQLAVFDSLFNLGEPSVPGQGGEARLSESYKMAATLLTMIPLFIIYFAAQRQFVEGIEKTGITGE